MQVEWIKCNGDAWCSLLHVDLNNVHFNELKGVYIIWSGQRVVRLGSGIVRDRLEEHRNNPDINKYPNLLVTWSRVNSNQMEGVEKYLADTLNPMIGERFPDRASIQINLPW